MRWIRLWAQQVSRILPGSCLGDEVVKDAVGDQVAGLERKPHAWGAGEISRSPLDTGETSRLYPSRNKHRPWGWMFTFAAHGNGVRHANGVVLPGQHFLLTEGLLYNVTELEHCSQSAANVTGNKLMPPEHSQCVLGAQVSRKHCNGRPSTYLQGLPSHHIVATPTCGAFFMVSSSGTPAAYSIAWRAQRVLVVVQAYCFGLQFPGLALSPKGYIYRSKFVSMPRPERTALAQASEDCEPRRPLRRMK